MEDCHFQLSFDFGLGRSRNMLDFRSGKAKFSSKYSPLRNPAPAATNSPTGNLAQMYPSINPCTRGLAEILLELSLSTLSADSMSSSFVSVTVMSLFLSPMACAMLSVRVNANRRIRY